MENNNESFSYTYSASRQEEIEHIRQKYIPPAENKMEQLRRLDESSTHLGKIVSIILGVLSTLVFGIGMCLTMVWTDYFIFGIAVGIIGMVGIGAAFPLYLAITKRSKQKIAPQIMKLSEELIGKEF